MYSSRTGAHPKQLGALESVRGTLDTNERKRLLVVSMTTTIKDVRIMRHVQYLSKTFDVVTIGYGEAPQEVVSHIQIPDHMKYLPLSPTSLFLHLLGKYELSSRNTQALKFVREKINLVRCHVALLNDVQTLPLIPLFKSPVVVDMHEYAPREMEDDWRFRFFLMKYYQWLCKTYLGRAQLVTTVSEGLSAAYEENYGVECTTVFNARELRNLPIREFESEPIRLIHSGLAARSRKLDVMINAAANHPNLTLDLFLVQAPRQSRELKRLRRIAHQTNNVRVMDPVPSQSLPDVINQYDLFLAYLAPSNFSLEHCMPNKLFDSIQARVGIVTGPSVDMAQFCKTENIGVSTEHFDSKELKNLLLSLSQTQINQFKISCDASAQRITAETEAEKMRQIISRISSK